MYTGGKQEKLWITERLTLKNLRKYLAAGNMMTSMVNMLDFIMQSGKKYLMKYFQYSCRKCDVIIVQQDPCFQENCNGAEFIKFNLVKKFY